MHTQQSQVVVYSFCQKKADQTAVQLRTGFLFSHQEYRHLLLWEAFKKSIHSRAEEKDLPDVEAHLSIERASSNSCKSKSIVEEEN